jgi:crotonobetainyl-CoA:carnitine CoA-transferase CaiB-like acyl-CoA transferase
MPLPLEGVRILALEQFGAGPYGSSHLADLGAEVIKIEDPSTQGDVGRYVPPYTTGEDSLFFETFNRGKKSLSLNLGNPEGRAIFRDLVRHSDAVYSNLRGDVPAKLGITYDDLKHINPRIVCCSLSGFGMTGPRRSEPGYDYVIQAVAGWMDITGEPDGPPTKSGLSIVDFSAGLAAALALVTGLHASRRDGVGMDCDVSLFETAMSMLSYPGVWSLNADFAAKRTRHSAHPSVVPFQAFEASDGWFVIAAPKDKFWVRTAHALGRSELASDPRFATMSDRARNAEALLDIVEAELRSQSVDHWITVLTAAAVPCGKVKSVAEAFDNPQVDARGVVLEADHPLYGTVRTIASPVRVGSERAVPRRAPQRGEHTRELLSDLLDFDETAIEHAIATGALGDNSG